MPFQTPRPGHLSEGVTWYLYAVGAEGLVDGPWGYLDEAIARESFETYSARAATERPDVRAHLERAEDIDALIAARPVDFAGATPRLRIRGARELSTVDRRVRMFTPMGLAPSAPMSDEDALVLAQQRLRSLSLHPSVPEVVSRHFDALCELQLYGSFAYDAFGMVLTLSTLAHELALGVKFIEAYGGRVPVRNRLSGEISVIEESSFGRLADRLVPDGSHSTRKGWRLMDHEDFRPSLGGLLYWARSQGLFTAWFADDWQRVRHAVISVDVGRNRPEKWTPAEYDAWTAEQQSRWWDSEGRQRWEQDRLRSLTQFRNHVAHPTSHSVLMPVDGIRALDGLATFINVLWTDVAHSQSAVRHVKHDD